METETIMALDRAIAEHREVYKEHHDNRVIDQLLEEMSELQTKLLQKRRERGVFRKEIVEEIMDVELCLFFIKRMLNLYTKEEGIVLGSKIEKLRNQLGKHEKCTNPPHGWVCSRERGHEGPCAALKIGNAMMCDHANEMPAQCTCDANCYCKFNSCRGRA